MHHLFGTNAPHQPPCHAPTRHRLLRPQAAPPPLTGASPLEAVVRAMTASPAALVDARVAEQGCVALHHIALDIARIGAIVEAGGVAAIVGALRTHARSVLVATRGCGAAATIARTAEAKQAIVAAGGPAAIIEALRAHRGDRNLAHVALWALANVATLEPGARAIVTGSGTVVTMKAFIEHESEVVAQRGLAVLARVARFLVSDDERYLGRCGATYSACY